MLYVWTRDRWMIAVDVRFSRTYVMLSDFSGATVALDSFETVTDPAALVALIAGHVSPVSSSYSNRCVGVSRTRLCRADRVAGTGAECRRALGARLA